jgi:hypothetical protein
MHWGLNPQKMGLGVELALSGHHLIRYARQVAEALEAEGSRAMQFKGPEFTSQFDGPAAGLVRIESLRG